MQYYLHLLCHIFYHHLPPPTSSFTSCSYFLYSYSPFSRFLPPFLLILPFYPSITPYSYSLLRLFLSFSFSFYSYSYSSSSSSFSVLVPFLYIYDTLYLPALFVVVSKPISREAVYVLVVEGSPSGTAFAISSAHVITAYHNIFDEARQTVLLNLSLTKGVSKREEVFEVSDAINIKVVLCDETLDWAILEVVDRGRSFPEYLRLVEDSERLSEASMDIVLLCAPIGFFLTNSNKFDLCVWKLQPTYVHQFDNGGLSILSEGKFLSGSSGGPCVLPDSGRVLVMHLGNIQLVTPARKRTRLVAEKFQQQYAEQSAVTTSVWQGRVLCRVPAVVDFINKNI